VTPPRLPSSPMVVRQLGREDEALLAEAVRRFYQVPATEAAAFLRDPATATVAALDDGQVVGWAWGHRLARADGGSMLLLYELEVAETQRRRGVGRSLLQSFLELARREGHRKVWLVADTGNEAAAALYQSTGRPGR
jgi:ribosomal protein S18 acetylase RimI-like enzyme